MRASKLYRSTGPDDQLSRTSVRIPTNQTPKITTAQTVTMAAKRKLITRLNRTLKSGGPKSKSDGCRH